MSPNPRDPKATGFLVRALAIGFAAVRRNLGAGILLQFLALGIIAGYYLNDHVRMSLNDLALWRIKGGYVFSALSTALFAGVLPFFIDRWRSIKEKKEPASWSFLFFLLFFWIWKGAEVDAFYRLQAHLFGEGSDFSTLWRKVGVDQLLYCPLWAVPSQALFFHFYHHPPKSFFIWREFPEHWYAKLVLPSLISNAFVWLVAVSVIYSMPSALQIPLFVLVTCFWSLMLILLTGKAEEV